MNWSQLICTDRLGEPEGSKDWKGAARTEFEKDIDRIIYCGSFRRLARKTQVHPLAANDHVHTRLTHSLETSRVGRELGKAVYRIVSGNVPDYIGEAHFGDLVQAACLAHDIGNPPFGHAGEKAVMRWCKSNLDNYKGLSKEERIDLGFFDGNAQGFRILTQLENHIFRGGLRLTYSTLATFLKYPRIPDKDSKKASCFLSEKKILESIAEKVGLPARKIGYARHPLAYLVEAADDICYGILDLEDAVELKIISFEQVKDILFDLLDEDEKKNITFEEGMFRVNLARLRGPVFEQLIRGAIEGFRRKHDEIMKGTFPQGKSLFDALDEEDPRRRAIETVKDYAKRHVYVDLKKVEVELGSYATLETLLEELLNATAAWTKKYKKRKEKTELDWRSRLVLKFLGDHAPTRENHPPESVWTYYLSMRRGVDFVAGCTDNYATYAAKQMRGMAFTGLQRP